MMSKPWQYSANVLLPLHLTAMENHNTELEELKNTFLKYQNLIGCPINKRVRNFYHQFLPPDTIIIDVAELYKREKAHRWELYKGVLDGRPTRPWIDHAKGHFFVPVTVNVFIEYYLRYGEYLIPTIIGKGLPCPIFVYPPYPFSFPVNTLDDCHGFFGVKGFDLSTSNDFASAHFIYDNLYTSEISPDVQEALNNLGFAKGEEVENH